MKIRRTLNDYYRDISQASQTALNLTDGMTHEQFLNDERTCLAVQKCLENIGEAVKNIPLTERSKHPEIPWAKIRGMRNRLVREYFGVNWNIIWETTKLKLPTLLPQVTKVVDEMDRELFDKLEKGEI